MKKFKWAVFGMAVMLITSVMGTAQSGSEAISKAQALLAQGRAVIGGEEKLKEVKGISIEGKIQQAGNPESANNPLTLKMVMMTADQPAFHIQTDGPLGEVYGQGSRVIINRQYGDGPSHGGEAGSSEANGIVIMHSDGDKESEGPGQPGQQKRVMIFKRVDKGEGGANAENFIIQPRIFPGGMMNWMQALLLNKQHGHVVTSFVGNTPDGQIDLIDFRYTDLPEEFSSIVGLDKSSHLPVLVKYKEVQPETMIIDVAKNENGNPGEARTFEKRITVHADTVEAGNQQASNLPTNNVELRLSDHRYVDGVMLPHHITKVVNGQTQEEWTIEKYELNPKIEMPQWKKHQQKTKK